MNDKCKYCDYVSKCSRICEYNSYLCKVHRSFPKVVDKSYEQLQQENKKLKMINEEYERLNKEKYRGFKIIDVQEYDRYELLSYKNYKDNWNKLKEYLINDINDRNGTKIAEFEEGNRVSETISPIYTLMEDKSRTMKEVLDKMQELEQGSDSNE